MCIRDRGEDLIQDLTRPAGGRLAQDAHVGPHEVTAVEHGQARGLETRDRLDERLPDEGCPLVRHAREREEQRHESERRYASAHVRPALGWSSSTPFAIRQSSRQVARTETSACSSVMPSIEPLKRIEGAL